MQIAFEVELSKRLREITSAAAKKALRQLGVDRVVPEGIAALSSSATIAGPVRTMRFLPLREDKKEPPRGRRDKQFIDEILPGEILVHDGMGLGDAAILGDNHV